MRIVIYSHLFAPSVGGVETQILSMAKGLHGRATGGAGKKVEVIILTRQLARDFDDRVLPFRVVRNPGVGAILACFRKADIVHLAGPSFLPLLAALALGKRVIVSHHGFQAACPNGQLFYRRAETECPGHFRAGRHEECLKCNAEKGMWRSWRMWLATFPRRWLCQRAALNIVPTRWLGSVLELPRTAVVAHGVAECGAGLGAKMARQSKFCFVGRLVSTKGVDTLLAAAKQLQAKGHRFQLHVIGEGPERARLEASAKRGGLNGTVEFLGAEKPERVEQELAESLAVVVPSRAGEVFGLVAAESMMAGRAVVTSDIGALQEVSGETGLRFPAGNAEALAEHLESLLQTPGLAARLGDQARVRAEALYSMDRMVREHLRLNEETASQEN